MSSLRFGALALVLPFALAACTSGRCCRKEAPAPAAVPEFPAPPMSPCAKPGAPAVHVDTGNAPAAPIPTPPPTPGAQKPDGAVVAAPGAAVAPGGEALENMFCPVVMGEPVDPKITLVWKGKLIGFCSETAKQKFLKDPEKYAKNLP
jgi:YHS domain-containing protein